MTFSFFLNSALLGVGLAMDAFSVSLANGLADPKMRRARIALIAGTFAFFQYLMPMIGWLCVHAAVERFSSLTRAVPWVALALLGFIGGKMIFEGARGAGDAQTAARLSLGVLTVQGIATSIDALSVGFTIAEYGVREALVAGAVIAAVTFIICVAGVLIGRRFGTRFAGRASIFGGVILIAIGLEIFIKGVFFGG